MTTRFASTTDLFAHIHATESALPLRHEACRSKFFLHPQPTSKVLLFLHGFTAGPYQGGPLGKAFFEAGYNALVPLMPGHGQAGNWNFFNPPPLPEDIQTYQQFVLEWIKIAQTLGQQVVIGGLSTSAILAAWVALNYADQIKNALMFGAYFENPVVGVDWLIDTLPLYYEWLNKDARGNFGYPGFSIPALRIFRELGQDILSQASTQASAPILVACSGADKAAKRSPQREFFNAVLKRQSRSWYYRFDESLEIHHRMMTQLEGNDYEQWVNALAIAFVESNLTWRQLHDLAHQVAQGVSVNAIATTFKVKPQIVEQLASLVSAELGCQNLKCIQGTNCPLLRLLPLRW